jgi:hypothetical protein
MIKTIFASAIIAIAATSSFAGEVDASKTAGTLIVADSEEIICTNEAQNSLFKRCKMEASTNSKGEFVISFAKK